MRNDTVTQITATPKQLAVLFSSYTEDYWRRLLRLGVIPGSKPGGKWFVRIDDVRAFLEGGHERPDAA